MGIRQATSLYNVAMKTLSLIVAMANQRVIGINNTLPWHLPEDLKRFKALTMGHHIIMGRKTYESLGRLLPGRTTVIVTRNPTYQVEGALIAHSLDEALELTNGDDQPFLIGGAALYRAGIGKATEIYLTQVHADFAGDAFLPEFDLEAWEELSSERFTSEKGLDYSYIHYCRKQT